MAWLILHVGGATAVGRTVALNPPVFGADNVQDGMQAAETRVVALEQQPAGAGPWQTTGLSGVAPNARYRLLNSGSLLQYMANVSGQSFNANNNINLGTLPAGFRPARDQNFAVYAVMTATGTTFGWCQVYTSGTLYYVCSQATQAFNISIIAAMG